MENVTLVATKPVKKPAPKPVPRATGNALPLHKKLLCAGTAACIADLITFPLDTAKVRLQIQGEGSTPATGSSASKAAAEARYRGVFGTLRTICKQEGPRAMYNGLAPGLQRQMAFASVRIGLYDNVKQAYVGLFNAAPGSTNVVLRILAGITTGGAAVLVAQPTDVVKVRMQATKKTGPSRYTGVFNAYKTIGQQEGVKGLWKGTTPNVARNAVVNACELVSYDLIKETILKNKLMKDNIYCHFMSAFGAGFCTTCVASPVDVVKTRFMNSGAGTYTGVLNCAAVMFKKEGVMAFYKGFMPSFMRLGSWNVCMFVCFEQLKRAFAQPVTPYQQLPAIEIEGRKKRVL